MRMTDTVAVEDPVFLSTQPAGDGERRVACAVIVASTCMFLLLAPFAKLPLGPMPAFIPIYQSALVLNDLITAVFLLGQSRILHSKALCLLAGGYLFTALMAAVHTLSFPGIFAPDGLLYAGSQTTAWLYIFWHAGFPLFVVAYAGPRLKRDQKASPAIMAAAVVAATVAFTLLTTWGHRLLPPLLLQNHYTPAMIAVIAVVWLLNLLAVLVLSRHRPYSALDTWLLVVMSAWLFDIALSAMLNAGRYDLGWYAGRIYGLMAASFVLMAMLHQNGKLYYQLHMLREIDRDKAAEFYRLSATDQLTGLANRRAFDDAIGQEWRRMMRHGMALSLLLIDVDFFKRFNDTYGHVAGDQCLRAVGQVLAGKARRAGELAARYGGEEFAILLPHVTLADARKLGEAVCAAMREQNILHEKSEAAPCVTVSVGVATINGLPELAAQLSRTGTLSSSAVPEATVLIEMADQALYRAKVTGRNRVVEAGVPEDPAMSGDRGVASVT